MKPTIKMQELQSKFDQFDPETKDKIDHVKKLLDALPGEASDYVIDRIFIHCLFRLRSKNKRAEEIADTLEATGALVFILEDFHFYLESGHATDAPAYHVKLLEMVNQAVKLAMAEESGGIH